VAAAAARLDVTEGTIRRWIRAGRLNPNCGQVYAQVMPYLDRELSADERAAVDQHIAACPGCEQHFAFDGTILHFVRQRAPRPIIPESLHARLLAAYRSNTPPDA
jgi:anti-sigma factor (TIGR02949 family)